MKKIIIVISLFLVTSLYSNITLDSSDYNNVTYYKNGVATDIF